MNHSEILERLEKATGGDRELDIAIAFASRFRPREGTKHRESFDLHEAKHDFATSWIAHAPWRGEWDIPAYTASIDAAVALVERCLPGAVWHLMTDYGALNRAKIGPINRPSASIYNIEERELFEQADGETPALALLSCLFRALSTPKGER